MKHSKKCKTMQLFKISLVVGGKCWYGEGQIDHQEKDIIAKPFCMAQ